jgi:hypothetical protein
MIDVRCRLPIADRRVRIDGLAIGDWRFTDCRLPIRRLPIHGLSIHGLSIAEGQRDSNPQSTIDNPSIDDPQSTIHNRPPFRTA